MKTVRPKNLKQRIAAELAALAELNQAEEDEGVARTALKDARAALDRQTILDHVAAADPFAARAAIEAAVSSVVKHTAELRAEFDALDALLETQRGHALMAMRIARLNSWEPPNIAPLPPHLARALMLQAEHAHGGQRIVWAAPLADPRDLAEGVKAVTGFREPTEKWHEFRDSIGTPEEVVKLAIAGELQPLADEWDGRIKQQLEAGRAEYQAKIDNYTAAYQADKLEHSESSRSRLKAAREAFRPTPRPDPKRSPPKATTPQAQSAEADRVAT